MKKELVLNFILTVSSALALTGLTADLAKADRFYYSPAPSAPEIPEATDSWYITTSDSGVEFYGISPFLYQQTTDGNFFIATIVVMTNGNTTHGSYVMIDCGRLSYRDLVPWFIISQGNEYIDFPPSYNWRYFRATSVFEIVGRTYCQKAAQGGDQPQPFKGVWLQRRTF